jgi:ELWxxDGT repeat protein
MSAFGRVTAARAMFVVVVLGIVQSAAAGAPHLVRDINTSTTAVSSNPTDFSDQGTWSFVNAEYKGIPQSYRPFATDGTSAGTVRLDSINPIPNGVTGYQPMKVGSLTFFLTSGAAAGEYLLWVSDGTAAGTRQVMDFGGGIGTNPGLEGVFGNRLLFSLYDQTAGKRSLWLSDGTASGTLRITAASGPSVAGGPSILVVGQTIYFLELASDSTIHPWMSDGTPGGAQKLADLPNVAPDPIEISWLARAGQYLLFAATTSDLGRELWRIDTISHSVSLVADIASRTGSGVPSDGSRLMSLGNTVVFGGSPAGDGTLSLWRSDGTTAGTYSLGAIAPVAVSLPNVSGLVGLFLGGGPGATRTYFVGNDGTTGQQIYVTDGTVVGTVRLSNSALSPIALVGSAFYFYGTGSQLWRTDGTVAGTAALNGIPAGQTEVAGDDSTLYVRINPSGVQYQVYRYDSSAGTATQLLSYSRAQLALTPSMFGYARGRLFFDGEDPVHGHELWTSDGTASGTQLLSNIAPEVQNPSSPAGFLAFNGQLYFAADDGISGRELWRSDGTLNGTQLVVDLNPGSGASDPLDGFVAAGRLYFFAKDASGNYHLWQSDGTAPGTSPLAQLSPPSLVNPGQTCGPGVALGSMVYFAAADSPAGLELWRTDGTAAGTTRVLDISAGSASSAPCYLTVFNNRLYFAADGGPTQGGLELWSSDGTASGTARVGDIAAGALGSAPRNLLVSAGKLYFLAHDGVHGDQVWTSDGTASGTVAVTNITTNGLVADSLSSVGNRLLFATGPLYGGQSSPAQIWATDSSAAGASPIAAALGTGLFINGGHTFFTGAGPGSSLDIEPWVTDGTASGTSLLLDAPAGFAGAAPVLFENFNGVTLIQVSDGAGGARLWKSDGTPAGTTLIGDIGAASTVDTPLTHLTVGQNFFYTSDDGTTGAELYALNNEAPIAGNDAATAQAGTPVTINVIANDSDPDGSLDPSSVLVVTQPQHGTVTVASSGSLVYTADAGFSGTDSLTYTVADSQGARSAPATVQVTVTAPASSGGGSSGGGTSPPTHSSGGGGRMPLMDLVVLAALVLCRWIVRQCGIVRQCV